MNYYLGAYQLLKLKPLNFGAFKGQKILTGSRCLNESYFDAWALSWTEDAEDGKDKLSEPEREFNITKTEIKEIQKWADKKFNEKHLGWINTFNDFETIIEYKNKFFKSATDFKAIGIYFPETAIQGFINEFEPQTDNTGGIGILDTLKTQTPENMYNEEFMGYDLIGMEFSGDYHSFHCYGNSNEIIKKFGLKLNESGLITEFENKQEVLSYANNPENGFPPVPWYLVKVKSFEV